MFALDRSTESLNEGIVCGSALAVHGYLDSIALHGTYPMFAGILGSLVRINNLWDTMLANGFMQHGRLILFVYGVGELPSHYKATVHVDNGRKVHKAMPHRYVGNINGPHLVRPRCGEVAQQIGMNVLGKTESTKVLLGINRHQGHFAHQATHPFVIVLIAQIAKHVTHALHAKRGVVQEELINELYEREIQLGLTHRVVI